jgi:hypothetical protein
MGGILEKLNDGIIPKAACFWILGKEHRRPACELWRAVWGSMNAGIIDQSLHGRDGHAPFLRDEKSNFKETLVLAILSNYNFFIFIFI